MTAFISASKAEICGYFVPFLSLTPEDKLTISNMCNDDSIGIDRLSQILSIAVADPDLGQVNFSKFSIAAIGVCEEAGITNCLFTPG